MLTYKPKNTVIHRLNPLCKIVWVGSLTILSIIFENPIYLLMFFIFTLSFIVLAKIGKEWLKFMKFVGLLCLTVILLNMIFSNEGTHVIFQVPFLNHQKITLESFIFGVGMALRLVVIFSAFTILTFIVHPDDFMLVMLKLKFPFHSVFAASLSTRFIPTLLEDAKTVMDVCRARGLELNQKSFLGKIKSRIPFLTILLSNSLDRAVQIAEAMESRAFGLRKRTFYKELKISWFDGLTLILTLSLLIFGCLLRVHGYGSFQCYPFIQHPILTSSDYLALLIFVFIAFLTALTVLVGGKISHDQI